MDVQPAGNVQRLQVFAQQHAVHLAEVLQEIAVAVEGAFGVALQRVVEEQIADDGDAERVGFGQLAVCRRHQAVICLFDLLWRTGRRIAALAFSGRGHALGMLAELMAGIADLDEPSVLCGPIPRMMRTHEQDSLGCCHG